MKNNKLLERLELLLKENPNDLSLRLELLAEYREDIEKIAELLEIEISKEHDVNQLDLLGDFLVQVGDERIFELEGKTTHLNYLCAKTHFENGNKVDAVKLYRDIKEKDKGFIDPKLETLLSNEERKPKLTVFSSDESNVEDLFKKSETISFKDVGGLEPVKKQIHKKIILPYKKPSLFSRFKRKVGGGILMYGPPGVGKTMMAKATAGECNANFINVAISDVLDMYIGESERKMHQIFETARSQKPTVLFFDEIEALATKRQYAKDSSTSKLISQFLSELDGFSENNEGVLILGSTNVPWSIDSAFLRPGRFDRTIFIPPPDSKARETILHLYLQDRPKMDDINYAAIVKRTSGFSGADLKNLVDTAVDEAIEDSILQNTEVDICHQHFVEALNECKPTVIDWLSTARNYAKYSNESGMYSDLKNFLDRYTKK